MNFFMKAGPKPRVGLLAAPFFSTIRPIEALTDKGCDVRLVVRFSPVTTPEALREAFKNPRVKVRYFTDRKFHTKLYIVDDVALVGSANLTEYGMNANHELSVLLRQERNEAFYELPGIFDDLWNHADVLNEEVLREYTRAFKFGMVWRHGPTAAATAGRDGRSSRCPFRDRWGRRTSSGRSPESRSPSPHRL